MYIRMLIVACLSSLVSQVSIASEYADFLRDLSGPYAHYRQSLMLTSNANNIDKARRSAQALRHHSWLHRKNRPAVDDQPGSAGLIGRRQGF